MKKFNKGIVVIFIFLIGITAALPLIRNNEKQTIDNTVQRNVSGEFIKLSKGYAHYQIGGAIDKQVVILVHGFSVPMYIYDSTYTSLTRSGFRVVRFDLWGRGYSSRPHTTYNLDLFVQETKELIDSLHLSHPVDLIGVSMGGTIVAGFVSKYPKLVRKVVLIDPHVLKKDISPLDIPIIGDYFAAVFWIPSLPKSQLSDFYYPEKHPDWSERYREQMQYNGFRYAIVSTARNILNHDFLNSYRKLNNVSVLLFWGKQDKTIPKAEIDTLLQLIKPEFFAIDHAGHLPQIEQASTVNQRIMDFLKQTK